MSKLHKRKDRVKPQFKVEYVPTTTNYNPIMDKNLDYYFASKQNKSILRKNGIINRRNQVIDKDIIKLSQKGYSLCADFRVRNKSLGLALKHKKKQKSAKAANQWGFLQGNNFDEEGEQEKEKYSKNVTQVLRTEQQSRKKHRKRGLNKTLDMEARTGEIGKQIFSRKKITYRPQTMQREEFVNYLQLQKQKIKSLIKKQEEQK